MLKMGLEWTGPAVGFGLASPWPAPCRGGCLAAQVSAPEPGIGKLLHLPWDLTKLRSLSVPQFPYLSSGDNSSLL